MKKFDRAIFIFIGLGIWALAFSQLMKPSTAVALGDGCGSNENPCIIDTRWMGSGAGRKNLSVMVMNNFAPSPGIKVKIIE